MRTNPSRAHWLLLAVGACIAACSGSTSPDRFDLSVHRAEWEEKHIASYQYDYLVTGYFIDYAGRPIRLTVHDGAVESAVYISDGTPVPGGPNSFPTIDQLFDRAAEANAHDLLTGIRYDSRYDFPAEMDIAGSPDASGIIMATNLEPAQ
jgi:hypothetical protein